MEDDTLMHVRLVSGLSLFTELSGILGSIMASSPS